MVAFLALISFDPTIVDRVDAIELNHCGDYLTQVIFWDWSPLDAGWRVLDWRLAKGMRPRKIGDRWLLEWIDGQEGQPRRVWANQFSETWTAHDPEVTDRIVLPVEHRRKLTQPAKNLND